MKFIGKIGTNSELKKKLTMKKNCCNYINEVYIILFRIEIIQTCKALLTLFIFQKRQNKFCAYYLFILYTNKKHVLFLKH